MGIISRIFGEHPKEVCYGNSWKVKGLNLFGRIDIMNKLNELAWNEHVKAIKNNKRFLVLREDNWDKGIVYLDKYVYGKTCSIEVNVKRMINGNITFDTSVSILSNVPVGKVKEELLKKFSSFFKKED